MTTIVLITLQTAGSLAQTAPGSPDHPWHAPGEQRIEADAENFPGSRSEPDPVKTYSLPEQIDLAQTHNPETRFAWERAGMMSP